MISRVIVALVLVDLLAIIFAVWMGGTWPANIEVAYWSSALVLGGTLLSYARMVRGRLATGAIPYTDDRDGIDQIDDPHGLYDEEGVVTETPPESEITAGVLKDALREEKARNKAHRRSIGETFRDSRTAMSFWRLGAYGALVFGFLYLRGHHLLTPLPYLVGLAIPIVVVVGVLMMHREEG